MLVALSLFIPYSFKAECTFQVRPLCNIGLKAQKLIQAFQFFQALKFPYQHKAKGYQASPVHFTLGLLLTYMLASQTNKLLVPFTKLCELQH